MASPFLFLAHAMHQREFSAQVAKDINRIRDGQQLRNLYLDTLSFGSNKERDEALDQLNRPECSVLELLCALADRLKFMYDDSPYEKTAGGWMHELVSNLQLGYMTDHVLVEYPEYQQKAMQIMTGLIERTFEPDGKGGLFPLKHAKRDQRAIEIWEQMMDYCAERYDMSDDGM